MAYGYSLYQYVAQFPIYSNTLLLAGVKFQEVKRNASSHCVPKYSARVWLDSTNTKDYAKQTNPKNGLIQSLCLATVSSPFPMLHYEI